MPRKMQQKFSVTLHLRTLKWSHREYLCKYSWPLRVPEFGFILTIVYDQCVSADSGEAIKLRTPILCLELERSALCSYLIFLRLPIFYGLVPIKWNCCRLAVARVYTQDIYMLLKVNKSLERLKYLTCVVCKQQIVLLPEVLVLNAVTAWFICDCWSWTV